GGGYRRKERRDCSRASVTKFNYDDATDDAVLLEASALSLGQKTTLRFAALTAAGDPQRPNEDTFAARREGAVLWCVVFDGVTSLEAIPELASAGATGARFASHFLKRTFYEQALDKDPAKSLLLLNDALAHAVSNFACWRAQSAFALPASTAVLAAI